MLVGVPKEIKTREYRVGLTPSGVREIVSAGHKVIVQRDAGSAIGLSDDLYKKAGADLISDAKDIFARAEMIVKVKEPQLSECQMLHQGQVIFTYLHLAPDPDQAEQLIKSKATCIAYETVTDNDGGLPLLAPMSEVAGRMAAQEGARCLEKTNGGSGVLLGGVPGVTPGKVVVIGGGVVGLNAARIALGMGADVTILDRSLSRLRYIDEVFCGRIKTLFSTLDAIEHQLIDADLVIGAVLIPGAAAPRLVTRNMLSVMKPGSALVDVAIDQGGCFETSKPTTHDDPIYMVDGIVHYCVANMPGGVAKTATYALTNATLPYVSLLAEKGYLAAITLNQHLQSGLNIHHGHVTHPAVAAALGYEYVPASRVM